MSLSLSPKTRHKVSVSFDVNEVVTLSDVKEFIIDALETMGGCRHPDDVLFGSLERVRVALLRKNK